MCPPICVGSNHSLQYISPQLVSGKWQAKIFQMDLNMLEKQATEELVKFSTEDGTCDGTAPCTDGEPGERQVLRSLSVGLQFHITSDFSLLDSFSVQFVTSEAGYTLTLQFALI